MRTKRFIVLLLVFIVPVLAVVTLFDVAAHPASIEAPAGIEVVAGGLSNPRGLTFSPDGALFVAEAGRGGNGDCLPNPEGGDDVCYGTTGAVTRILSPTTTPTQSRIVTGLASVAVMTGTAATGPHDVVIDENGQPMIVVGLGADPTLRNGSSQLMNLGQLVSATMTGTWTNTVDIAAYEVSDNPDGAQIDSNPFAMVAVDDGYIVSDAGANALLHISSSGTISTVAVFPTRTVEFPPGSGNMIPMDSVPTDVTVGPDGAYYVGQLTGFPFPVGGANVYRVVPGEEPEVYAGGFTNITGIDFDADGNLYVLETATNSLLSGDPTGALIRVTPYGLRQTLASAELVMPTGLAVGPDGAAYVSNFGIFPAFTLEGEGPPTGQVIRVSAGPIYTYYFPFIAKD